MYYVKVFTWTVFHDVLSEIFGDDLIKYHQLLYLPSQNFGFFIAGVFLLECNLGEERNLFYVLYFGASSTKYST